MSFGRLTALFLLLFFLAVLLTGIATYTVTGLTITRLVDRRIAAISDVVAGDHDGRPDPVFAMAARIARFSRERDTGDVGFLLVNAQRQMLAGNVRLRQLPPSGFSTLRTGDGIPGLTHGRALVRAVGDGMTLVTVAETEPLDPYDAARLRIYLAGFGSIVVIVLGGVALFGALVTRRIAAIRATADAIIAGDLSRRVPVSDTDDEFDRQAVTMNRMLDRITDLMDGLRHISGDIAHDLRAPLARLRSNLARVASGTSTPPRDSIDAAIAECDDLLDLFAAILRIGEIEGSGETEFAAVDLAALATATAEMMAPVAAEDGREIVVATPPAPIEVMGDARLLTQAILNLVENALAHTPVGTRIILSVSAEPGGAQVVVRDDGPGIAPDDRAHALRRFGRLDPSRSGPGHGLGLPIVDAIARVHRGSLMLSDAEPGVAATLRIGRA